MEFRKGQLVKVKNNLNPNNIRIITGYEEEKGLYLSKRATKKGEIDKRSEQWILKCPGEQLQPIYK